MTKWLTALMGIPLASCGDGSYSSAPTEAASGFVESTSSTGMPTATRTMQFEPCLTAIRSMADDLAIAPVNVVETNDVRIVRFNTSDGSVLVTCSRPDQKMFVVQSPHQG